MWMVKDVFNINITFLAFKCSFSIVILQWVYCKSSFILNALVNPFNVDGKTIVGLKQHSNSTAMTTRRELKGVFFF